MKGMLIYMMNSKKFWEKAKDLPIIEPYNQCLECGENLLITDQIEPIGNDYFKGDDVQKCIVECTNCNTHYLSDYDT